MCDKQSYREQGYKPRPARTADEIYAEAMELKKKRETKEMEFIEDVMR